MTRNVDVSAGLEGQRKTLRDIHQDKTEARRAANVAVREIKAGEGDMPLLLVGYPLDRASLKASVWTRTAGGSRLA